MGDILITGGPFRKEDGTLVDPDTDMTIACSSVEHPNHGVCTGWISPTVTRSEELARECRCSCHDGWRMPFAEAREKCAKRLRAKGWVTAHLRD